jgi:peptide/nickel transport system permease protein
MTRYIIRRILQAIPLLLIISMVLFVLMENMGDPVATLGGRSVTRSADRARLTCQLGLDYPAVLQYVFWLAGNDWMPARDCNGDGVADRGGQLKGVLRGDFGTSLVNRGKPVIQVIGERIPNTLLLMVTAEIVIILLSLLVGIYSALHQYSLVDNVITALSFILYSLPIFMIALLSMFLFGVSFKAWGLPYLPTIGMYDPKVGNTPLQVIWHMILPVLSIALISLAGYSRYIRSTMLEVMSQDYIRTARSAFAVGGSAGH